MSRFSPQIASPCRPGLGDRSLVRDEVHLYFSYPEQISDPGLLHRYEALLSDDERIQQSRFYHANHRHRYLVTRALIRTSLSAYYQVEPSAWRFDVNGFGKPGISHPDSELPIRFNLSHANGLIICGIAREYDIGVDVEDCQRSKNAGLKSLSSYFSPQEAEELRKLPAEQQKQRFFDYWTLKEAYIKARGAGLSIPLRKFSFLFQANKLKGFSVHPDLLDDASHWQFWRMKVDGQYLVAVAVKAENSDMKISAFKSVPLLGSDPLGLTFL